MRGALRGSLFYLFYLVLSAGVALAARPARVQTDQTALREAPVPDAKILQRLPLGTVLQTANEGVDRFHKVRLADGTVGFVLTRDLALGAIGPSAPAQGGQARMEAQSGEPDSVPSIHEAQAAPPVRPGSFTVRAGGGFGIGHFADLNTLIGFDSLSDPIQVHGELEYRLSSSWVVLARVDYLFKSLSQSGNFIKSLSTVTRTYQFDLSVLLTSVGLGFALLDDNGWHMEVSAFGTVAPVLSLTATLKAASDISTAAPNATTLSALGFGGVARVLVEKELWRGLGLGVEAGYHLVTSAQTVPATSPNGSDLFAKNSAFVPVALQATGFYFAGQLGWRFR